MRLFKIFFRDDGFPGFTLIGSREGVNKQKGALRLTIIELHICSINTQLSNAAISYIIYYLHKYIHKEYGMAVICSRTGWQ